MDFIKSLMDQGLLVLDKRTVMIVTISLSLLFLAKSLLEIWASKTNLTGTKITAIKEQLVIEEKYSAEREEYTKKYLNLCELLAQARTKVDESALYKIHEATTAFLSDFSRFITHYAFIQKHGFKNKIELMNMRGDVLVCLHLYLVLYELLHCNLKLNCDFSFSRVKSLYLFLNQGILNAIKTHICHREVLKVKKIGSDK